MSAPALTPTATAAERRHVSKCPACSSWRWDAWCRVCQLLEDQARLELEGAAS